ncbi:MAG: hypothetical protein BGO69_04855 [Bacteroidetes bacterium 46-16]|nr:MAG: hypothetical protein BGO69_04855 [Bacteroidetes bacterium 46-16]
MDKRRNYNWLKKEKEDEGNDLGFHNTWAIASNVNLTEDRVRYISSIHPKIKGMKKKQKSGN